MLKGKLTIQPIWMQKKAQAICGIAILLTLGMSLAISNWGSNAFFLSIALVAGIACILISIQYERFPMYLLVASLSLSEMLKVEYIPSTLLIIPGSLAIFSLLVAIAFRKKPFFLRSPVLILGLLLAIWASLATFYVGSISEARPYWLVVILLILVPNLLTEEEHLLRACWLFLLPLGALGAYVFGNRLFIYLTSRQIDIESLHLSKIMAGDKNIVGLWLTLGIPFVFYLFGYYKWQPVKRFWLLVSGIAMLAGAIATLSIGVALGLCALIGMLVWLQPGVAARLRSLALGVVILSLLFSSLADRLQTTQLSPTSENWGSYRGELWNAGLGAIQDHPVFGIGIEPSRRIVLLKYTDVWFIHNWYNNGKLVSPHNIFLSVGVDIGVPGLMVYTLLLVAVLLSLLRLRHRLQGPENQLLRTITNILLVSLICGWVQGQGLSVHLDKLMWFLLGSAVALIIIEKSKTSLLSVQPPVAFSNGSF